jgi:hypothetical protein
VQLRRWMEKAQRMKNHKDTKTQRKPAQNIR